MNNQLNYAPVSVVMPCYKAELFLRRAVNSVLSQSLLPLEVILIDDASPDNGKTKELIAKILSEILLDAPGIRAIPIYLDQNSGPGGARNAGWAKVTQPWIAFLDADDIWAPNKLALQYQCLQSNPSIDLLAHKSLCIKENLPSGEEELLVNNIQLNKVSLKQMLVSNLFPTRSVMLRSSIPIRFPGRGESEDYSLWLRMIAKGYDVRLMDCVLAYTFRSEFSKGGYSGQLWDQEKRELHTLLALYRDNYIKVFSLLIVIVWSFSKFLRRILIKLLNH